MGISDFAYRFIVALACIVIILRAEPAISRMTPHTDLRVRFAIWLCLVGAVARLWWVCMGGVPDSITVLLLVGLAALLMCERRIRVLTGIRRRP